MNPPWQPEYTHHDFKIIEENVMYPGYCSVKHYSLQFRLFKGGWSVPVSRELVSRPPAVAVVLYDPRTEEVILIEQIRVGALMDPSSPWLLEIVAGLLAEEEVPEDCARRESLEETGYEIESLIPIGNYWLSPGFCNEKMQLFCGRVTVNLRQGYYGVAEEHEDIKVHVIPCLQAFRWLEEGKIVSAPAVIGLQWLALNRHAL